MGKSVGEECEVNVTFPEDYHAKELAGKPVVFKVRINGIREKEVPALDDDFVKEASETADTVDEYKAEIRANLEKAADSRAETSFENEVLETICENAKVEIPDAMIEDQIDNMLRDMEMRMAYQGLKMDDYLRYSGQTREQMRDMYKPQAEERVKSQLVLEAVKNAENITPDEVEIDAEIAKFAEQMKRPLEDVKKDLTDADREYFTDAAAMQKTIKFLKDNAE